MNEFNPPWLVDEEDRAKCEDIALWFKNEHPEHVATLRQHVEEGVGPITDRELDRLLILCAEHAWLGILPGERIIRTITPEEA